MWMITSLDTSQNWKRKEKKRKEKKENAPVKRFHEILEKNQTCNNISWTILKMCLFCCLWVGRESQQMNDHSPLIFSSFLSIK